MTAKIISLTDPCSMVIQAAHRIWSEIGATVQYDEQLEEKDLDWATAEDDNGNDIIILNPYLSVLEIPTALAQAITRLKVGQHVDLDDEEFLDMFNKLVRAYTDTVSRKALVH